MGINDYIALGALIVSFAQLAFDVIKWIVHLKNKKPPQGSNLD